MHVIFTRMFIKTVKLVAIANSLNPLSRYIQEKYEKNDSFVYVSRVKRTEPCDSLFLDLNLMK